MITSEPVQPRQSPAIYRARNVSKTYRMGDVEVTALRNVDLEVEEGRFVVVLGPSGSGKSTLLNLLGGLDQPTTGELWYRSHDLSKADDRELTRYRRVHLGFVFQFYNLVPSLTARENVALAAEIAVRPLPSDEALQMVGLADRMDHFPSQMSGGQQQRVAIARAIAKRPEVLLCDEPTGALDVSTGKIVLEVLARVQRELGTTVVVITHNAAIAAIADRVLVVADGHIARNYANERRASPEDLTW